MNSHAQLPLALELPASRAGDDFLVAECNRDAVRWLDRWPQWPSPALILHGPGGCGKSHLAAIFRQRSGGISLDAAALAGEPGRQAADGAAMIIDDADELVATGLEEPLLHLYNVLVERRGHLLLTAACPPARWRIRLADLRSRLCAAAQIGIGAPGEEVLAAVLVKLFCDRQLAVDEPLIRYALSRIERSFDAARRLVAELDAAALGRRRRVTVPLLREILDGGGGGGF